MANAQEAMALAALGWRVQPLYSVHPQGICTCRKGRGCGSPGKHPVLAAWEQAATTDEETIAEWWDKWPDANIGVVLGPTSGIIDLESDSPEAEQFLQELFAGYEVYTPTFKSSRGTHRLFAYTDELPNNDKAHWRLKSGLDLDFKIGNGNKGTYCVFPPSRHASGAVYQWVISPWDVPVATLPQEVIAKLHILATEGDLKTGHEARSQQYWDRIFAGVSEGERNESAARLIGKFVAAMSDPSDSKQQKAQYKLIQAWNQLNNPPLPEEELQRTFKSIVERHIRSARHKKFVVPPERTQDTTGTDNPAPGWELVRIEADPPRYKLFSPLWEDHVLLDDSELMNVHRLKLAVQKQKCVALDPSFKNFWNGTKQTEGAHTYLFRHIRHEAATFDEREENIVAMRLYERLQMPHESEAPESSGRPVILPMGDIWFSLAYLREQDRYLADYETTVIKLLKSICRQKDKVRRIRGKCYRFKVLSPEAMKALKTLAFYDAECTEEENESETKTNGT